MTRPIQMIPTAAQQATGRIGLPASIGRLPGPLSEVQPKAPGRGVSRDRSDGDRAREQAHVLLAALQAGGLSHLVVSSGSRSTPLTLAAAERAEGSGGDLVLHDIVDERSAAFFALGLARATGVAPALLCTSGSAAAHYHPAVLEAAHAGLPLLILSADRPPEAQGRGAHQTIDQAALFRGLCRSTEVLGLPDGHPDTLRGVAHRGARAMHQTRTPLPGPVHLIAPFRKPLEPGIDAPALESLARDLLAAPQFFAGRTGPDPAGLDLLAARCQATERGLIVVGPQNYPGSGAIGLGEAFWGLVEATGFPVVAEAGSQLRLDGLERPARIDAFPALLANGAADELSPELILRLGAEPSSLGFAAWLARQEAEVWLLAGYSGGAADGENRCRGVIEGELEQSLRGLAARLGPRTEGSPWLARWQEANDEAQQRVEGLLASKETLAGGETLSEAAVLRATLQSLPAVGSAGGASLLVLGNSLPLRMADLCGPGVLARAPVRVHTQRGTSGIDGTVAGTAGLAVATGESVTCVLGDLSLAHDLGSLGLLADLPTPATIVVPNNAGGRIFELLPAGKLPALESTIEQHLVMPGPTSFEQAAAHFGLGYTRVETVGELEAALALTPDRSRLIEAVVPPHAARDFIAGLQDGRRAG